MPAFPIRVACESLKGDDMSTSELLPAFADSLGIFYNYSKVRAVWPPASTVAAGLCRWTSLTHNLRCSMLSMHTDGCSMLSMYTDME